MSKLQVQAEIDFHSVINKLTLSELENMMHEISATITRKKAVDKPSREAYLLRTLNEECVLPEKHLKKFKALKNRQETGDFDAVAQKELAKLIKEEEKLRLKRIKLLGEIAQLRGVNLQQLVKDLGLKPAI